MIHVERLRKSFGRVSAVAGVSFDVARGEVVGLLGPNGAGKTTTMRIITGFLPADDGLVSIGGTPVIWGDETTRRLIGYLPENAPLYPDLEVIEHIAYVARLRGIPSAEIAGRIRDMVDICGLESVIGRSIGRLSKGFRQRVGLALALVHHPPVLILDEPTTGLDPNQIAEIRALIRDIGRERTVMLSTHILQEVEATCARALIIANGALVGHGTLDELARTAAGDALYTAQVRTSLAAAEAAAPELSGLELRSSHETGGRVRLLFQGDTGSDRSEDIFAWAVAHGWRLGELRRETASLEKVFRELTH